jgi:ring-1,2-phenylacetyl-CoA epoxidase subunit PaaD
MVPVDTVWRWLEEVPDPEIPVVSVVDLGIVRDVAWDGETLVVAVTPTYSGCPATAIIKLDIEAALHDKGIDRVRLERRLSPPWTTDWMTDAGREKLRAYGIAPPSRGEVVCPVCGSAEAERVSQFGSTPCKATYRCRACLEPFDRFKCL